MVKLIIVDDDAVERFSLRNYIKWGLIGVEVVGDAWNGMQAIDMTLTLKPDIVLADIKMPVMDGLEMAKKIKAIEPSTKIILCSAHDDFTFAREAVNLNAFGYILKPVRDEELLNTVKKAADKCLEERMQGAMVEKLKSHASMNFALMREAIVHEFLLGNATDDIDILKNSGLDLFLDRSRAYGLLLIRWAKNYSISPELIRELQKEIFGNDINLIPVRLSLNEICILLQMGCDSSQQDEYMQKLCLKAEVFLKEKIGANVCAVYATGSFEDGSFATMLPEANAKIELHWAHMILTELNESRIIRSKPGSDGEMPENTDVTKIVFKNDISRAFHDANKGVLINLIRSYLKQVLTESSSNSDWYEQGLFILSTIVKSSREQGYNPFKNIDEEISNWTVLLNMKSLESIGEHLVKCAESIIVTNNNGIKDKTDFIISQIERTIERHYNESLTVEQIANILHFSPNYLGAIFKAKRNISLSEYITKYRICRSLELLRGYCYSITDIAQLCGYENIPYFHTVFKKYTGITPNQYRQMIKWAPGEKKDA